VIALAILATLGATSQAQAVTHRPALEDADVLKLAGVARKELVNAHSTGCIVIADPDGLPLYLERQVDAYPNCLSAALAKAKSAALFEKDTNGDYEALQKGDMTTLVVPHLSPNPGGVPLRAEGIVVGSIAISTADGKIDEKVVRATLATWNK
jgi:glc operon protein GlcG